MDRDADRELVDRLLDRDENALRDVLSMYGSVVHGIARRVLAEPALAEEVAQDVFLALWRRPGAYDPERGSLQAFLAGMSRNKAIDVVRREESRRRTKDSLFAETAASVEGATAEQTVAVEERQAVTTALARLPMAQREAIVLAYYGGRTYREVAEELGIPEGTAKTRLRDGLGRLRALLAAPRGSE